VLPVTKTAAACNRPLSYKQSSNTKGKIMTFESPSGYTRLILLLIAILAVGSVSASAQRSVSNVPASVQFSKDIGLSDPTEEINITVHFQLPNRAAFDKAVDALYDRSSPTFHHWMTNADLRKFAPTESQRQIVREELEKHGLTIVGNDKIGFILRAHGTIGDVERAFNTEIHDFEHNGKSFRANVRDARLSGEAANYVSTVAGLERHQVHPLYVRAVNPHTQKAFPSVSLTASATSNGFPPVSTTQCLAPAETVALGGSSLPKATYSGTVYSPNNNLICDYLPNELQAALGLIDVYDAGYDGKGQSIVLVEGYGYPTLEKDGNTFSKLAGLPLLNSSNFEIVYPEGKPSNPQLGILTGWNIEMALDLDWAHSIAPGAKIVEVLTNGQDNEDFQYSISYVTQHDLGNSVSNSYGEDLDLIAGALEQTSWDNVLEVASAKGISVNFSTGDGGDNGLGTPVGAPSVPSVAPHATAVGGTTVLNDISHPGATVTTSWGDTVTYLGAVSFVLDPPSLLGLFGGGSGGESTFWPKPSWQSSLPGKGRQTPDVSALSDPYSGVPIVVSVGSVQQIQYGWGGTSLGCPIFSAFWAIANQKAGARLGQAAPLIASLPYGSLQDVLPTTDSSPQNVKGTITDSSGTTTYSASKLFGSALEGNKAFTSTIWEPDAGDFLDFGFGIDSSLTVRKGWDNATGFGTPYGLTFLNAVAP
jgi:subtilase family serine protease